MFYEENISTVFYDTWFMSSEDILTRNETYFCILAHDLIIEMWKLLDTVQRRLMRPSITMKIATASF